jgi:hypothetical protein
MSQLENERHMVSMSDEEYILLISLAIMNLRVKVMQEE